MTGRDILDVLARPSSWSRYTDKERAAILAYLATVSRQNMARR